MTSNHNEVAEKVFSDLADKILSGGHPTTGEYRRIALLPEDEVFALLPGAAKLRAARYQKGIHLCTICNAKSGGCSEDCAFCSQSRVSTAPITTYHLMSRDELQQAGRAAARTPIHRYSLVTSGKRISKREVRRVAEAISDMNSLPIRTCASLGILGIDDLKVLKEAGMTRYHHNLETARSHFPKICTTHSYESRVRTIRAAKEVGLSVCSGGIFGIGETDEQVLKLALALKELDVDAVPINFLIPIEGTPLGSAEKISPLRCLKIIALFRYVLPGQDIYVCGGRAANLKSLHPFIFHAGASGIMTGNYLTTKGRRLEEDLELLRQLSFYPRAKRMVSQKIRIRR